MRIYMFHILMAGIVAAISATSCNDDDGESDADGDSDGDIDGDADGDIDGDADGDIDGDADGDIDGDADGDERAVTDRVEMQTSMGTMTIELYGNAAPVTVTNFLSYVDEGFYAETIFHRVIPDFMIQGGGFDESLSRQTTHPAIELEIVDWLLHEPGVLSMARTNDPNSATSQFFICVSTSPSLDGEYAAFGRVADGYEVAEAISVVATHSTNGMNDVPVEPILITSASRID